MTTFAQPQRCHSLQGPSPRAAPPAAPTHASAQPPSVSAPTSPTVSRVERRSLPQSMAVQPPSLAVIPANETGTSDGHTMTRQQMTQWLSAKLGSLGNNNVPKGGVTPDEQQPQHHSPTRTFIIKQDDGLSETEGRQASPHPPHMQAFLVLPKKLNFEERSVSQESRSSGGPELVPLTAVLSQNPPDETIATADSYSSCSASPGGGVSLSRLAHSPWMKRRRFSWSPQKPPAHVSLDSNLRRRERLGWCLLVIGILLLLVTIIVFFVVDIPDHWPYVSCPV